MPTALAADLRRDPWAKALGLELLELRRGQCRFSLTLKPHMLNSPRNPHGGVIFYLADSAVGAASSSHGETAVALDMTSSFLAAVSRAPGSFAEAIERRQGRHAGFYDVTVGTEDGVAVASVHCVAHRVDSRSP
ncbi:MAG TPA: PaaI family thioesterase [Candidatus Nitrosotalea sp.]|nr:PaaI family thioesterase [Candidatus Nitrosotalea sp.]